MTMIAGTGRRFLAQIGLFIAITAGMAGCVGGGADTAPHIFEQPPDRSGFLTQTVSFGVGVEGASPLSFQWRRNGADIPGATTSTYVTPALTVADNGARFSIVVTNPKGAATSSEATLTVVPAPTITAEPVAQTVTLGATATFTVAASGEQVQYQWRRNDAPVAGATLASYTTPATVAADDGAVYSVDVGNGAGIVSSIAVPLTVLAPAAIATAPFSQSVAVGQPVIFSVLATGGELSYQWQRNGIALAGATARIYALPAAALTDNGSAFAVVATNPRGAATSSAATLSVASLADNPLPALPANVAAAKTATASAAFVLVRRSDGTLASWGFNTDGQRGDGTAGAASDTIGTVTLPAGSTVTAVAAGGGHALALLGSGAVYVWGRNNSGQLGLGDGNARATPALVTLPRPAVAIAAGRDHSVVVLDDGRVFAWGTNTLGQLGTPGRTFAFSSTPLAVPGLATARSVAAGNDHSLALLADGSVWAWGANASGQIGNGSVVTQRSPVATGVTGATRVRAGGDTSLAITTARAVLAWGENADNQLGRGAVTADALTPTGIYLDAVDADAADRLVQIVGSDGALRSAGANEAGSIGDATTTARNVFTAASGLANVLTANAGGRSFALALRSDGTVFSWGDNSSEQLGNAALSATGTSTPTAIPAFDAIL